ncbi:histidine phosphatase family protein [Cryobacterium mannosilyticum]|uniref:Histidine phosphatase family protein n=1 Tax=Cryobacterium mannosilyticum TaxID=1259190 RepID=A0A4R8WF57_9MICO|nr:histidine phosphatase family protein [Cryobacterium mannosilyticum]TFC06340.1 histidine phosphatase family protein [Cryobacterium mannosilyticum]
MAQIHFVRHAETLFNVSGQLQGWCDSPLTERGERQAAALGERMRDVPLAAAFVSDLTRTRSTMTAALAGHPQLEPTPLRELREWHFGSWEGQPNADLWTPVFEAHGKRYAPSPADWPGVTADGFDSVIDSIHRLDPIGRAETGADVTARVTAALEVVVAAAGRAAEQDAGDVLVVTHGSVLGSLLRSLVPEHRFGASVPNCGVVSVSWQEGKWAAAGVDSSCGQVA